MIVEQETWLYGTSVLHGIQLHLVPILGNRAQRSRLTVDLHLSDLEVWHSQRLCEVLNGLQSAKIYGEGLSLLTVRQEIIQLSLKQKVRSAHRKIIVWIAGHIPA